MNKNAFRHDAKGSRPLARLKRGVRSVSEINTTYRQLEYDEIRSIGRIDNPNALEARCKAWSCRQLLTYTTFKASAVELYLSKGIKIIGIQNPEVKTKNFDLTLLKKLT